MMMPVELFFITTTILLKIAISVGLDYNLNFDTMAKSILYIKTESPSLLAGNCYKTDDCTYGCMGTSANMPSLIKELETHYSNCGPISLALSGAYFDEDKTFSKADLDGNFILKSLTLWQLHEFTKIEDFAFDKPSLHNLEKLIIAQREDNGIETINQNTFKGLKTLKIFEFRNREAPRKLIAAGVLTPLAETLEELTFVQNAAKDDEGYDPSSWFENATYLKLRKVDLKNNYFPQTLSENIFQNMKSLEILDLAACGIKNFKDQTFQPVLATLQYLDLSKNELKTLSSFILEGLSKFFIEVQVCGNPWHCGCDSKDFNDSIKKEKINFVEAPFCVSPDEWVNKPVKVVALRCQSEEEPETTPKVETTTKTTATSTTTSATTSTTTSTTTTVPTAESSNSGEIDTTVAVITTSTPDLESTTEVITTPDNKFEVTLFCKRTSYDDEPFEEIIFQDQYIYFTISSISGTSVLLNFKRDVTEYDLLYFTPPKFESARLTTITEARILITALYTSSNYVFCLIAKHAHQVTPVNCRSHHSILNDDRKAWLSMEDRSLFLSVTASSAIICFVIGLLAIYFWLRFKSNLKHKTGYFKYTELGLWKRSSTLIGGIKEQEAKNSLSFSEADFSKNQDGYVKYLSSSALPTAKIETQRSIENEPPPSRAPALPPLGILRSISVMAEINGKPRANLYDYVRSKSTSELSTTKIEAISLAEILPPTLRAPALPPLQYLHRKTSAELIMSLEAIPENFNEHEYQSLDEYQKIEEISCAERQK